MEFFYEIHLENYAEIHLEKFREIRLELFAEIHLENVEEICLALLTLLNPKCPILVIGKGQFFRDGNQIKPSRKLGKFSKKK